MRNIDTREDNALGLLLVVIAVISVICWLQGGYSGKTNEVKVSAPVQVTPRD